MPLAVSIDNMVASVQREIGFRRKVYPRWVQQKKMRPETAPMEIERMEAVLEALEELRLARGFYVACAEHGITSLQAAEYWALWMAPRHAPLTQGTHAPQAVAP